MDRRALLSVGTVLFSVGVSGCLSKINSVSSDDSSDDHGPGHSARQLGTADPIEITTAPAEMEYLAEQAERYEYIEEDDEFEIQGDGRTSRTSFENWGSVVARTAGEGKVRRILEQEGYVENAAIGTGDIPIEEFDADPDEFDTPESGVRVTTGKTYSADGELLADYSVDLDELAAVVPRYADTTIRFDARSYSTTYPFLCVYAETQKVT